MDAIQKAVFHAQVERLLLHLEKINDNIQLRLACLTPGNIVRTESLAFQLHNFYTTIEKLMRMTDKAFENLGAGWPGKLLDRMTLEIEGVRPALLREETAVYLHKFRSFRHFFRHAYTVALDHDELLRNLQTAEAVRPLFRRDVQTFLQQFEE